MAIDKLTNFLSDVPIFSSEKSLISHLEEFLVQEYLIRPLLIFSIKDKSELLSLKKCRVVTGKEDRLKIYSSKIINKLLLNQEELKNLASKKIKVKNSYYYYLNLGIKKNQFYFTVFSTDYNIVQNDLFCLSKFSNGHFKIIDKMDDLAKNQELIHLDDVTGLYNQRKLYKDLELMVSRYQDDKDPFSILFIDIDYFKKVNDTYGHLVGTRLLENVALDIKSLLRDSDFSYRYGGDEFVVILSDSNGKAGKMVGERILQKIRTQNYRVDIHDENKRIQVSVSIGVAEFPGDANNVEDVLSMADKMMYEAKESGRGIVFNTQDIFKSHLKNSIKQE